MPAANYAEDLIEDVVKVPAKVVGQEAEDEVTMQLEDGILAAVAAVGGGIGQVLQTVEFDHEAGGGAEEIDLHGAVVVEGNGERGIELEAARELRVGFQPPVEKGFAGAAGAGRASGIGGRGARGVDETASLFGFPALGLSRRAGWFEKVVHRLTGLFRHHDREQSGH